MEALDAALKQAADVVRKREAALDEREGELKRLKKTLDEKHPNLGEPSDVIPLNVGGTCISVLRRTLTQIEGSMLATKFSGRWDDSLEKDKDGRFFIDQPIALFLPLIDYLRDRACETPLSGHPDLLLEDNTSTKRFNRMVEYYGMTLGVYPIGIYRLANSTTRTLVAEHPDYEIESESLATFVLMPKDNRHGRFANTFEVELGDNSVAQIGWMDWSNKDAFVKQSPNTYQGAGYGKGSIAFDCGRSGMAITQNDKETLFNTVAPVAPGQGFDAAGTVLRCEGSGCLWHVNGNVVPSNSIPSILAAHIAKMRMSNPVPCVTIKGRLRITAIELTF